MTDALLAEIRERHRIADAGEIWVGADHPETAIAAFEDRAALLDEVDRLRAMAATTEELVHACKAAVDDLLGMGIFMRTVERLAAASLEGGPR